MNPSASVPSIMRPETQATKDLTVYGIEPSLSSGPQRNLIKYLLSGQSSK